MIHVSIRSQLQLRSDRGDHLPTKALDLLVGIDALGSLAAACQRTGDSYRHAWELLRAAEHFFGEPVVVKSRGRGTALTPLGQQLVDAQHRLSAQLSSSLEALGAEVAAGIEALQGRGRSRLQLQACHSLAVQGFAEVLTRQGIAHTLTLGSTREVLDALRRRQCDWAGVHIPLGPLARPYVRSHLQDMDTDAIQVIHLSSRRQGLLLPAGNPLKIHHLRDLLRPGLRFVNRPNGSGTRWLFDALLAEAHVPSSSIAGYEQVAATHSDLIAAVAHREVDVAFGAEPPDHSPALAFLPLQWERYVFLCRTDATHAAAQAAQSALLSPTLHRTLRTVSGETIDDIGYRHGLRRFLDGLG